MSDITVDYAVITYLKITFMLYTATLDITFYVPWTLRGCVGCFQVLFLESLIQHLLLHIM